MTDTPDDIWAQEEGFWLGSPEVLRGRMAGNAVMVFPWPAGILQGDKIIEGMEGVPRWRSVTMSDRTLTRQGATVVLAYRAEAEREGQPIYRALCASTYINDDGTWMILSHQQTPIAEGDADA